MLSFASLCHISYVLESKELIALDTSCQTKLCSGIMTLDKNRLEELQTAMRLRNSSKNEVVFFRDIWKALREADAVAALCRCGRQFDCFRALHCLNCGSVDANAVRKLGEFRNWLSPDGKTIKVYAVGYRCRRCSTVFTDMDTFQNCEAPPLQPTMKEIRSHDKANDALRDIGISSVDEFKQQLEAFRSKKEKEDGS